MYQKKGNKIADLITKSFRKCKKIILWFPKKVTKRIFKKLFIRLNNFENRYSDLQNQYNCLESKINENLKYIIEVEKNNSEFKSMSLEYSHMLENKVWELNYTGNIILYEHDKAIKKQTVIMDSNFNPKISIIIPAYNAADYLNCAIESALNQTYKNLEIIVINDGSTDNGETEKIALSYGEKIRYFCKKNGGVSSALNFGIEKMAGDYFAWLSHDDLYMPDHLEKHIEHLKIYGTDKIITFSNFNIIDENSNEKYKETIICGLHYNNYKLGKIKSEYSLIQGEINGGNILIPKKAFETCGLFNEKLKISQEREMWSRLMKNYTFMNIPYITASIREHSNRITNINPNILKESNETRLNIIDNLDEDVIIKLEKNRYNFYQAMEEHFKIHRLTFLQKEMKSRKKNIGASSEDKKNSNKSGE